MTPKELPDKLTTITAPALWNELLLQWETLGVNPKRCAVELKMAHVKLETGFRACHNWNLGNIKSVTGDGCDWQYFSCGEEIPATHLAACERVGPGLVTVKARYQRGGQEWLSLWISKPHPWTKFKAYETLADGLKGQLEYLKRHPDVLAALMTGDAEAYNDALVAAHYYTAGKAQYLAALKACQTEMTRACRDFDWGDVA